MPSAKLAICRRLEINDSPPPTPPARLPPNLVGARLVPLPAASSGSAHRFFPPLFFLLLLPSPFLLFLFCKTPASHGGVLPLRDVGLEWICFGGAQSSLSTSTHPLHSGEAGRWSGAGRAAVSPPTPAAVTANFSRVQRLQVKKSEDDGSCFTLFD